MSGGLIKGIGLLCVAGGAMLFMQHDRLETFAEYGLQGDALVFAESCDSAMRDYDVGFSAGASNHAGCACMAKTVATNLKTPDYRYLGAAYENMLEMRESGKPTQVQMSLATELMGDTTGVKAEQMTALMEAAGSCSDSSQEKQIRQAYLNGETPRENVSGGEIADKVMPDVDVNQIRREMRSAKSAQRQADQCAKHTPEMFDKIDSALKSSGRKVDRTTCQSVKL